MPAELPLMRFRVPDSEVSDFASAFDEQERVSIRVETKPADVEWALRGLQNIKSWILLLSVRSMNCRRKSGDIRTVTNDGC